MKRALLQRDRISIYGGSALWVIRTRYDHFGKDLIRRALGRHGRVVTDAEVPAEPRRVDVWFTPRRRSGAWLAAASAADSRRVTGAAAGA